MQDPEELLVLLRALVEEGLVSERDTMRDCRLAREAGVKLAPVHRVPFLKICDFAPDGLGFGVRGQEAEESADEVVGSPARDRLFDVVVGFIICLVVD